MMQARSFFELNFSFKTRNDKDGTKNADKDSKAGISLSMTP